MPTFTNANSGSCCTTTWTSVLCDANADEFIRIFTEVNGVVSYADVDMDGVVFVPVLPLGDCDANYEVEHICLQDDNGQFIRHTVYALPDGTVSSTFDTEVDMTTPYVPIGAITPCQQEEILETEQVCMQDDNGKFIRHTVYTTVDGSVSSTFDTTSDMTTAYTTVGIVSTCTPEEEFETEQVCMQDDNGKFIRHTVYASVDGSVSSTFDTTSDMTTSYITAGIVNTCTPEDELETEQQILCDVICEPMVEGYIGGVSNAAIGLDGISQPLSATEPFTPIYRVSNPLDPTKIWTFDAIADGSAYGYIDRMTCEYVGVNTLSNRLTNGSWGVAFHPNGTLYIAGGSGGGAQPLQFETLDLATGVWTDTGVDTDFGKGAGNTSFAIDSNGVAYLVSSVSLALRRVDLATGVSTVIGTLAALYNDGWFTVGTELWTRDGTDLIQISTVDATEVQRLSGFDVGAKPQYLPNNPNPIYATRFVRHTTYTVVDGTVVSTFDTELDMATAYVPTGTVMECTEADTAIEDPEYFETEQLELCDNVAAIPVHGNMLVGGTTGSAVNIDTGAADTSVGTLPVLNPIRWATNGQRVYMFAGAAQAGFTNGSDFGYFDYSDGSSVTVGTISGLPFTGNMVAYDVTTDTYWVLSKGTSGGSFSICTLDITTGVVTDTGNTSGAGTQFGGVYGLAINSAGVAYLITGPSRFGTLDMATGVYTQISDTIAWGGAQAGGGLAVDDQGRLWANVVGVINEIDPATGAVLGAVPGSPAWIMDMEFVPEPLGASSFEPFIRHTVYSIIDGSVISTFDTEIDMTTAYIPVGTVGACATDITTTTDVSVETEQVCMQDDNGQFVRHTVYAQADGSVVSVFNTAEDMTTAYITTGTVSLCVDSGAETEQVVLCDTITESVKATLVLSDPNTAAVTITFPTSGDVITGTLTSVEPIQLPTVNIFALNSPGFTGINTFTLSLASEFKGKLSMLPGAPSGGRVFGNFSIGNPDTNPFTPVTTTTFTSPPNAGTVAWDNIALNNISWEEDVSVVGEVLAWADMTFEQDVVTTFVRHTIYDTEDGSISGVFDTELDMATTYTSAGIVSACESDTDLFETEQLILCDTTTAITASASVIAAVRSSGEGIIVLSQPASEGGVQLPGIVVSPDIDPPNMAFSAAASINTPDVFYHASNTAISTYDQTTGLVTNTVPYSPPLPAGVIAKGLERHKVTGDFYMVTYGPVSGATAETRLYSVDVDTGVNSLVVNVGLHGTNSTRSLAITEDGRVFVLVPVPFATAAHEINIAGASSSVVGTYAAVVAGGATGGDGGVWFNDGNLISINDWSTILDTVTHASAGGISAMATLPLDAAVNSSVTKFVRHTIYDIATGDVVSTFDTELDMVTPYVIAGTVSACSNADKSISVTNTNITPTITNTGGIYTTIDGAESVTILNIGVATITINAVVIPSNTAITFVAYLDSVTNEFKRVAAIIVDATGSQALITEYL